jgi:tetratricopeptide (TPR) repeat protein
MTRVSHVQALRDFLLAGAILLIALSAIAVMYTRKDYPCPVCGKTVTVSEMCSWGPYVYDRPSKYDLVFPPYSEPQGFWMCGACGYAQTARDFLTIAPDDARKLRDALAAEWTPIASDGITFAHRLERALRTNEILGRDDDFWLWFYRALAYNYQSIDPDKAREFAKREIELLEAEAPAGDLTKKQRLYLLGEYHRRLGDVDIARRYLASALRKNPLCWLLLAVAGGAALGAVIAQRICRRRSTRIAAFVAAFLVVVAAGFEYSRLSRTDPYLDEIVKDRLQLIKSGESSVP